MKNKKILSLTLAVALAAGIIQTSVFAAPATRAEALRTIIQAIVAIEPGGTPEIGSEQYNKFLAAKTPIVIYFGDYIDNGPSDIQSTSFWKAVRDGAVAFAESYNKDGGNCTVINLPDIGITGNSHFMFREKNSEEIANHIEN